LLPPDGTGSGLSSACRGPGPTRRWSRPHSIADTDGIAVVPRALADAVLADVIQLERREAELVQLLEGGVTTLEALGLE
jgi:hypothetical protein